MTRPFLILLAVLTLVSPATVHAEPTSKEYAEKSLLMVAALQCAGIASYLDDDTEGDRLFLLGLEAGREFIGAVQNGKVRTEDFNNTVPVYVSLNIVGPSPDFALGSIWSGILEDIYDKIIQKDCPDCLSHQPIGKRRLKRAFREKNCRLIE